MSHCKQVFLLASLSLAVCDLARADDLPARVGDCAKTAIKSVETRLIDESTNKPIPGSGSAVSFENGGYQVSYDTIPAIEHSKAGDPVQMCLVSVPDNCPKDDDRGRVYRTTNLRTHKSWTLRDSEHMCGGA
ncbi:MAG TPA: hypothetical protein VLZ74_07065 [Methylocella sp.]|nr:hypothetical protein [Methylocella sp.]